MSEQPDHLAPRLRRVSVLLLAAAFAVAGCGGSGSEEAGRTGGTASDGQALSKDEYIAQGDAICAEVQAEAAGLAQQASDLQEQSDEIPKSEFFAQAAEVWADQIGLIERFLGRLRELGAPLGDEAEVEQFLASVQDGLDTARQIREHLLRGEDVPQTLVAEYGRIVIRGNTLARAYGFRVCGQSP